MKCRFASNAEELRSCGAAVYKARQTAENFRKAISTAIYACSLQFLALWFRENPGAIPANRRASIYMLEGMQSAAQEHGDTETMGIVYCTLRELKKDDSHEI